MVENFLREYTKLIVDFPERIQIQKIQIGDDLTEIIINADKIDVGKLIGREGKMINAIKTVVSAYKSKDLTSYKVTVRAFNE